jgi:hypothetical protein
MRYGRAFLGLLGCLLCAGPASATVFQLKPEWAGPCQAAATVDVNLGNSPENFVKACNCQITGALPPPQVVSQWAQQLRTDPRLRRVDVARSLEAAANKRLPFVYSNPWANDPELPPAGPKKTNHRDIGAITMFFFNCPGGVNCGMDWASAHVDGMQTPSNMLAWNGQPGYYDPKNPGFWTRELHDAKAAGLDFLLANVYGPDMQKGQVQTLAQALAKESDPVKVALMDDTWPWGEQWFGPYWQVKPDLNDPTRAAAKLYEAKWKPFFTQVPRKNWYLIQGRPLIYFYNGGKLQPLTLASATMRRMKDHFKADFGVEPFVAADVAYYNDPDMKRVADEKFIWVPLDSTPDNISWSNMKGVTLCHAITRWDAMGRDKPGQIPGPQDRLHKGPEILEKVLAATQSADILVLGTWNDLGEGTSLNRAYDYYYLGQWQAPDTYIQLLRQAHEQ